MNAELASKGLQMSSVLLSFSWHFRLIISNCRQKVPSWEPVVQQLLIISLFGIFPLPHSLFLTLHILEWTEWASLFIGLLKDLLKGPTLNGRWGVGWYAGVSGGSGGLGLYSVCCHSGLCHTSQKAGRLGRPLVPACSSRAGLLH